MCPFICIPCVQGLARFGLTRAELANAGLNNDAIDRVYRCLYVYTIGFFDVMQVSCSELSVWQYPLTTQLFHGTLLVSVL